MVALCVLRNRTPRGARSINNSLNDEDERISVRSRREIIAILEDQPTAA